MKAFDKTTVKISVSDFILFCTLGATQIALSLHKNVMLVMLSPNSILLLPIAQVGLFTVLKNLENFSVGNV